MCYKTKNGTLLSCRQVAEKIIAIPFFNPNSIATSVTAEVNRLETLHNESMPTLFVGRVAQLVHGYADGSETLTSKLDFAALKEVLIHDDKIDEEIGLAA